MADEAPAMLMSMASEQIAQAPSAPSARLSSLRDEAPAEERKAKKMQKEMAGEEEDALGDDMMKMDESPGEVKNVGASVAVKYWDPATPYLNAIKNVGKDKQYDEYINQRKEYKDTPAFYLDVAHHFFHHHTKTLGVRILSNIIELKLDNPQLLRMVGYKLDEQEEYELAHDVFTKVLALRADEPQSYRDLGLVAEKLGKFQQAFDLLWRVVCGPDWSDRFSEIEVTALYELNALIAKCTGYPSVTRVKKNKTPAAKTEKTTAPATATPTPEKNFQLKYPENFDSKIWVHPIDVDLRISMAWDTDNTDMDLHVIEPNSEEAYYGHRRTEMGGMVSRDFRQGYGPEEYMLKVAIPGDYKITTNYFGGQAVSSLTGPTTLLLAIFTNYGRPTQTMNLTTIRLQGTRDNNEIGRITIPEDD